MNHAVGRITHLVSDHPLDRPGASPWPEVPFEGITGPAAPVGTPALSAESIDKAPAAMTAHTSGALRQKMHERFDLFPVEGLQAYSRVAEFGAKKYAPWNWAKGLPRMQIAASLIRHLWAYMRGEDNDPESGLSHADHVLWNAVALVYHHDRGMEDDRRPMQGAQS